MTPSSSAPNPYLQMIRRRWWLFILLPLVTIAVILFLTLTSAPRYRSATLMQIVFVDPQEVPLFGQTRLTVSAEQIVAIQEEFANVARLTSVAWKTIGDLDLDFSAEEFLNRITVNPQGNNFVVLIAEMPDPALAQQVAATHAQNALAAYRTIRSNPAKTSLDFIQVQLVQQSQTLKAANEALQKFQFEHEIGDLAREITAYQDLLRSLRSSRDQAQLEMNRNKQLALQMQAKAESNIRQAEALVATPLPTPDARESTPGVAPTPSVDPTPGPTPTSSAPQLFAPAEVAGLRELAQDQARAAQEYEAIAAAAKSAVVEYDRLHDERQQELVYLLGLQDGYAALQVDAKAQQEQYQFLKDKAAEAQLKLDQAQSIGFLIVVESAQMPEVAESQSLAQLLVVGAVVSLIVALILAFVLEMLETSLGGRQGA